MPLKYEKLSPALTERIEADRRAGWKNPHAAVGADVVRSNMSRDAENLWRPAFVRDIDKILHSTYYNRYADKTQVFSFYKNDDISRRALHVQLVSRIGRNIGSVLGLNCDLIEAIALGHDLGHTPFGHAGERALNAIYPGGFKHYEQSLRVVDVLEKEGEGLNLCYETRMGILNHTHGAPDDTREATAVRLCDRIAYINHDLDDSIRAGIVTAESVPEIIRTRCGDRNAARINSLITDLIQNSGDGVLRMSTEMQETFDFFHRYMFSDVYTNPIAKSEEDKVQGILEKLYDYYVKNPERMPREMQAIAEREGRERAAVDYISGMTDGYAMEKFGEIYIPFAWTVK